MLIVSDLHFGQLQQALVDLLLQEAQADPDRLVIISGDLTQNSLPDEYAQVSAFIDKLTKLNIAVVVTGGNHDFGGRVAEVFHKLSSNYQRARALLVQAIQPALKQNHVIAHTEIDSVSRLGDHVFVTLCSQHRGGPRIKHEQIEWASAVLMDLMLKNKPIGKRWYFHFVTHHSLWADPTDKHSAMAKLERLEHDLLKHFQFFSFIHGHNHRFSYQNTNTPNLGYRILRLSIPTLSTRNKSFERGFVRWSLSNIEKVQPTLVQFRDDLHLNAPVEVSRIGDDSEDKRDDSDVDTNAEMKAKHNTTLLNIDDVDVDMKQTVAVPDPNGLSKFDPTAIGDIKEYHFHVYFNLPDPQNQSAPNPTRDWAVALRQQIENAVKDNKFVAVLNRVNDVPRGPHPCGSYEIWVPREFLPAVLSFIMINRGPLSVLLHPLTRFELEDHTLRAFWLGQRIPLNFSNLKEDLGAPPLQYPELKLGYSAQ